MSDSEAQRFRRASRGDAQAMDELLARHLPALQRYVRAHVGRALLAKESTSDLVQSVCRELLQDLGDFEYQGEAAFCGWLQQAALRKIVDRHRYHGAKRRNPAREGEDDATFRPDDLQHLAAALPSPSGEAMQREEVERLERALTSLAAADRRLIRMVYVDGLSHAAIAQLLGVNEPASRKQLSRALARLSRHLA